MSVDNEASETATVVEVRAPDEIGLLHRITRALFEADLDVVSARVSTLGEIVVDAFYVRESDGDESDRRRTTFDRSSRQLEPNWDFRPASSLVEFRCHDRGARPQPQRQAMVGDPDRGRRRARRRRRRPSSSTNLHFNQAAATPTAPPPALSVVSVSPTGTNVAAGSTISVQFSTDLGARAARCRPLSPPVAGAWAVLSPSLLQYQASGPLVPGATETVTVPGGRGRRRRLARASTWPRR